MDEPPVTLLMAPKAGIEPATTRLTVCWTTAVLLGYQKRSGAATRDRTPDILLTRQALYQLSYSGIGLPGRIRTYDFLDPNQTRYQTALRRDDDWRDSFSIFGSNPRLGRARTLTRLTRLNRPIILRCSLFHGSALGDLEFGSKKKMAEDVRFELTEDFSSLVFKTRAINHSANLPHLVSPSVRLRFAKDRLGPARAFRPPTPRADIGEVFW